MLFRYHRQIENVSYWKTMAWPLRIAEHEKETGAYYLVVGKKAFVEQNFPRAKTFLIAGLRHIPNDGEAICMLANWHIYGIPPRIPAAIEMLEAHLDDNLHVIQYLELYMKLLQSTFENIKTTQVAESLLPKTTDPEITNIILKYSIIAYINLGDIDQAEKIILEHDLDQFPGGYALLADIHWMRGSENAAIWMLEAGLEQFSNKLPLLTRLVEYERKRSNYGNARRYILQLMINHPSEWIPRTQLILILDDSEDYDRQEREITAFLKDYADNERALLTLSGIAADAGLDDVAKRVYQLSIESEYKNVAFSLNYIDALINAERYIDAREVSKQFADERSDALLESESDRMNLALLRAIANAGAGDQRMRDFYLNELEKISTVSPGMHQSAAIYFKKLGQLDIANQLLMKAYNNYPNNQIILSELVAIELERGGSAQISKHLKQLLKMKRPKKKLLDRAYKLLSSDRFIFTRDRDQLIIELESQLGISTLNSASQN